jgi:putative phosphoesterase
MRLGLLADVHANLPALEAALAALAARGIGRYVCAGDLVGYGPFPNECVERIAGLDVTCVAGNHDLIVLGRLDDGRCIPVARETLRWTRAVLAPEAHAYLERLPLLAETGGVFVAHGTLDDPERYVTSTEAAARELAKLSDTHAEARALVVGHTHRPRVHGTRPLFVNPGAVGQSRELRVRARCAVLDVDALTVELIAVPYDTDRTRRALRAHGLPERTYHLRRSPRRAAARMARRLRRVA